MSRKWFARMMTTTMNLVNRKQRRTECRRYTVVLLFLRDDRCWQTQPDRSSYSYSCSCIFDDVADIRQLDITLCITVRCSMTVCVVIIRSVYPLTAKKSSSSSVFPFNLCWTEAAQKQQAVWPSGSADTVCLRQPLNLTFDRLKLVCESQLRWGTFFANLGTVGLWVLELFATYATDGQTDGRTDKSNA